MKFTSHEQKLEQRVSQYLNACNISAEQRHEILVRSLAETQKNDSFEQTMSRLRKYILEASNDVTSNELNNRLALFLHQKSPSKTLKRDWSMPPIHRSKMVPKDYTPKLIKAIRRLAPNTA